MTHDDAKHLLEPLSHDDRAGEIDVADWVMRDVRALARRPDDGDAVVWRLAALCAGTAAIVVGLATFAMTAGDENPLVEFASAASAIAAEVR